MDKRFRALLILFLFSAVGQAHASKLFCEELQGSLLLEVDPSCSILQRPETESQFPDVTFLAELGVQGSCFLGKLQGTLGATTIVSEIDAGNTLNSFPPIGDTQQLFTSAIIVDLQNEDSKMQGSLFLRASGVLNLFDFSVTEELVVVGGTKLFSKARGTVFISGNEFEGAPFSGTLCTRSKKFGR